MFVTMTQEQYDKLVSSVLNQVSKGMPSTERDLLETAIRDGLREARVRIAK
jgi:hypothetical protein